MERYELNDNDRMLIDIALTVLKENFDDGIYNHTVGCAIPPCGNCRQMLFEYCPDIKVIVNDEKGNLIKVKAKDLLPFAWQSVVC